MTTISRPECYHGGAFFSAIGDEFDQLERASTIISADVLDAWFPPSPQVTAAIAEHLEWLVRTSPPTGCEGLIRTIARMRDVDESCILAGGGSSDLIFLALTRWLDVTSRVLILDPMYGEYAHVLEQVVGCQVDRFTLPREDDYDLDVVELSRRMQHGSYDLVILVNPNSPTGRHCPAAQMRWLLDRVPADTRVWIDETYVEYAGEGESLERDAVSRDNVIVCKSMSKVYALSGVRAAYLCGAPDLIEELRPLCPPWAVSLPAQVAACEALSSVDYYAARWSETHALRAALRAGLEALGWDVVPGVANFLLCHLPEDGPTAADVVESSRRRGVFVREVGNMGTRFGPRVLRVAVKDELTNHRMLEILSAATGTRASRLRANEGSASGGR